MNWLDILLLTFLGSWLGLVVFLGLRRKKRGCGGCCAQCAAQCRKNPLQD